MYFLVKRMLKTSLFKLSILITLSSLVTACGFHLRGNYSVPEELQTLSVTSYDPFSVLTRSVQAQLRLNHIKIVEPSSKIPNLHIINESIGERTLSLYQNTRAAEKELTLNTSYRVTIPNIGEETFSTSVTRSYLDNPLTALAKSVEQDMIKDEMRTFAAAQIMRQMSRLKAEIEKKEQSMSKVTDSQTLTESDTNTAIYNVKTQKLTDSDTINTHVQTENNNSRLTPAIETH